MDDGSPTPVPVPCSPLQSPRVRARQRIAVACATAIAWSCGGNGAQTTPSPVPTAPPAPTVNALTVTGSAPLVGATSQFTATAAFSNGTTQNVTSQASWRSSNPSVASVNGSGVVSGLAAGTADVTATYQSASGTTHLAVSPPVIPTYAISGLVTDGTSGGVLPNINVQVSSGPSAGASAKSDSGGRYTVAGVRAGTMTLSASATSYQSVDKTITVTGDTFLDFILPRVPAAPAPAPAPSPTPSPAPSPGSGAFVQVDTDSKTCGCSRGTISVAANGVQLGTTTCTPQTHTFGVAPGSYTLHACDDLGCWNDDHATLTTGQTVRWLLTCTSAITPQKASRE